MVERNAWYAIPTCNPGRAREVLPRWRAQGWGIALMVDEGRAPEFEALADVLFEANLFPGWCRTACFLSRYLVAFHGAKLVATGGDDIEPPVMGVQDVDRWSFEPFDAKPVSGDDAVRIMESHFPDGMGVVQPTGDDLDGVDRICGSPWFGLGWILMGYSGVGPVWPGYLQYYADEELKVVSEKLGMLAQRPDIRQVHHHWTRVGGWPKTDYQERNDRAFMGRDGELFACRRASGFPMSSVGDPGEQKRWPAPIVAQFEDGKYGGMLAGFGVRKVKP